MKDTQLNMKPVNELLGKRFFVPAYQRGYRWTSTQVKDLLDDVHEFYQSEKTKEAFYCLQPLVLKEMHESGAEGGSVYEVIDGQQRLTTILIILQYFNKRLAEPYRKQLFRLQYETRSDSAGYLEHIDESGKDKNIDYHHIYQASQAVERWFKERQHIIGDFESTLLNATKVIWYEIGDNGEQIEIFTRLNIGKIPLTNSELIKALLLKSSNFKYDDKDRGRVRLKQLQISSEWDRIENTLQDDSFWYFLYNGNKGETSPYDNRIEYIFDLMAGKGGASDEKYAFSWFSEKFEALKKEHGGMKAIDSLWLEVKKYFLTFEEWYHDRHLYHVIGFLISSGTSVARLLQLKGKSADKHGFKEMLDEEIKGKVNCQIEELEYGKPQVKTILLLFNIQTILINKKSNIRFPFDRYKNEQWDVEHVRSQNDKQVEGRYQKVWIEEMLKYFTGKNRQENMEAAIEELGAEKREIAKDLFHLLQTKEIDKEDFEKVYGRICVLFKEDKEFEIASISNLALLDSTTNRAYKNSFFPVKREYILGNERRGVFVPICTKNVFMKAYSKKFDDMMYWGKRDAQDYLSDIIETLRPYLPIQNGKHGK
ncbi:MAG: DUF262 domain-containing protein [Saprospiraceae bacterium]